MKLQAQFVAKENSLYTLEGSPVQFNTEKIFSARECITNGIDFIDGTSPLAFISVSWDDVGRDEENYDEAFLASFRDFLKLMEEKKSFCVIVPVCEGETLSETQKESFTASMKHCARRIKDAASVVGFSVPEFSNADFFIEELSAKHAHYIFFSADEKLLSNGSIVRMTGKEAN